MYVRDCSIAAEPAGRGPIATSCRRCSHARLESNAGGGRRLKREAPRQEEPKHRLPDYPIDPLTRVAVLVTKVSSLIRAYRAEM